MQRTTAIIITGGDVIQELQFRTRMSNKLDGNEINNLLSINPRQSKDFSILCHALNLFIKSAK